MRSGATVYRGRRLFGGGVDVRRDGFLLLPRLDLRRHSPTGFEWGYGGSGPAQLALALLADFLRDDSLALVLYQPFKWRVVIGLNRSEWELTGRQIADVVAVLQDEMKGGAG